MTHRHQLHSDIWHRVLIGFTGKDLPTDTSDLEMIHLCNDIFMITNGSKRSVAVVVKTTDSELPSETTVSPHETWRFYVRKPGEATLYVDGRAVTTVVHSGRTCRK